jgi:4-hydroxybenzoyl-CoA thioesterase
MFTSTRKTRIEWGDCDPAGIIFFARYFEFFDVSTIVLIERALGMKKIDYLKAYNFSGHPLVETRARFLLPTRFGDDVTIETSVVGCGRSSFKIEHRLTHEGALAVEGFEPTGPAPSGRPDDKLREAIQPDCFVRPNGLLAMTIQQA